MTRACACLTRPFKLDQRMHRSGSRSALLFVLVLIPSLISAQTPRTLNYAPGKSITLLCRTPSTINVAATGLRRVRFFAQSPDGRIFVTGMHDLSDNTLGSVFILGGWNAQTHTFAHVTHYLDHLRNPNNLAFWTDPATRQTWLYLPLTDKLVRYKYTSGDNAPASPPETLIRFPDYGLNYKYGGWHLTRTVAIAQVAGKPRVFVAAGSSCNYCQEKRSSPRSRRQHESRWPTSDARCAGPAQCRRPPCRARP